METPGPKVEDVPNSQTGSLTITIPLSTVETETVAVDDITGGSESEDGSAEAIGRRRRSSARPIKPKRFDEDFEMSPIPGLKLSSPAEGRSPAMSPDTQKPSSSSAEHTPKPSDATMPAPPTARIRTTSTSSSVGGGGGAGSHVRKVSKGTQKKLRKPKPPAAAVKQLGRWKPEDDLALITAVQQTCDLQAVHTGIRFTCKFTLRELQERWYSLLYDPVISKLAVTSMRQLHPDVITKIQARTLFSKDEERLLSQLAASTNVNAENLEHFQQMLDENPAVFHHARTAKSLFGHWSLMKQYHLLPDQSVQPLPKGDHILNFADAEDIINSEDLRAAKEGTFPMDQEMVLADRRNKREIRHLEQEIPKWQAMVEKVTGISPAEFDGQTLAVLRGRMVRYLMRSREITLGRATKGTQVDVNLNLEGPAWKISRRQGTIKLKNTGEFYIANEGRRAIYVDGKPVLKGTKQKLNNNSVVEVASLRFIFLVNQDLVNSVRMEAPKSGL